MSQVRLIEGKPRLIGRRSLLTPQMHETIVKYVEEVYYLGPAAQASGIHRDTAVRWAMEGEKHLIKQHPEGEECTSACPEDMVAKRRFSVSIKEAQAKFTLKNMKELKRHGKVSWQSNAWLLERTQPDEFGLKQRVEHTGKDGGPITHKLLSVERRQAILKAAQDSLAIDTQQDENGTFIPVEDE